MRPIPPCGSWRTRPTGKARNLPKKKAEPRQEKTDNGKCDLDQA